MILNSGFNSKFYFESFVAAFVLLAATMGDTMAATRSYPSASTNSRGYVTTPAELKEVALKAARGLEPYKSAVEKTEYFANGNSANSNPSFWPYGTINGNQNCGFHTPLMPSFLGNGAPLVEAKAMVFNLTGDNRYAAEVRGRILELSDTWGYGGSNFSGGNQCVLNLSWYVPAWIIAADLIADDPQWTPADKKIFGDWLATVVYPKVEWASDTRSNNWGAAGSATAAMIADYLTDSGVEPKDRSNRRLTPHQAFEKAKRRQLDRMNGNSYMDQYNCHKPVGIRPDGGIPEELARGSTGCNGLWIAEQDKSWTYTMTYMQGIVLHAELLLRRGDNSIYDNITPEGAGSLHKAILFLLRNPNNPAKSAGWKLSNDCTTLEMAYRFYRDPVMASELGITRGVRYICGKGGQMLHFGTLTHGFAPDENPGAPPTISAP